MSFPDRYYVKCRKIGKKRFLFISFDGITSLKIKALTFTKENANSFIVDNYPDNQDLEFKKVPVDE